jgi:hypothetical protein
MFPLSAKTFEIKFVSDNDTKLVVYKVRENPSATVADRDLLDAAEDSYKRISYDFGVKVLRIPRISTNLCFICCSLFVVMFCFSLKLVVGDNEVDNFCMDGLSATTSGTGYIY